jgi:hypothetical protein
VEKAPCATKGNIVRTPFAVIIALCALIMTPILVGAAPPDGFITPEFVRTWERTDKPVYEGLTSRTWMWGPDTFNAKLEEYVQAPEGRREVQYFDKSRMEDNTWRTTEEPWDVTNGLLAAELVTGHMQVGDQEFRCYLPSEVNIAGDPGVGNVTYADFTDFIDTPMRNQNSLIIETVAGVDESEYIVYDVGSVQLKQAFHSVADVFWSFMTSSGLIYNAETGMFEYARLQMDPLYMTGLPITEAYWDKVIVGGTEVDVLIQVFERRVLTYTPSNPEGWQVESGNVGLHYYQWRYEEPLTECQF